MGYLLMPLLITDGTPIDCGGAEVWPGKAGYPLLAHIAFF